jgi:hypothetical protein
MKTTECHFVAVRALWYFREDLYKQLKINRDLIDKALNEFEADTKCGLENNFEKITNL